MQAFIDLIGEIILDHKMLTLVFIFYIEIRLANKFRNMVVYIYTKTLCKTLLLP